MSDAGDVPSRHRVMITGASGLLGRAVVEKFKKDDSHWEVFGLANRRAQKCHVKIDLMDSSAIVKLLRENKPDFIVHCAAIKKPDFVEENYDISYAFNVELTKTICEIANEINSVVIFISTDYVFNGRSSKPYTETDDVDPLNKYGITKVMAEKAVMAANAGNCVLRIPILYGEVDRLDESGVCSVLSNILDPKEQASSNYEIRFPSHTRDIASIIHLLAVKKLQDGVNIRGIYQWSGDESLTKYQMTKIIAEKFNLDVAHIKPFDEPYDGAKRPRNVQLDRSKLLKLGATQTIPFHKGIVDVLAKFLPDHCR